MTITATTSFVQIPGNGSATVFAFPMKCFQASDVVVGFFANGQYQQQTTGYKVTNIDVNGGSNVVFITPPASGIIVDIRTLTSMTQRTEFSNLGQFLPENHTESFDRLTREVQDLYRLVYQFGVHGPDTEALPWPALPNAAGRAGGILTFDPTSGLPTIGVPNTQIITTGLLAQFLGLGPSTAESFLGITPTNEQYGFEPRRYGGVGDGRDDSVAVSTWIRVLNATTNPASTWPAGLTFMTGPLPAITANNITWRMGGGLRVKPDSWSNVILTPHLTISGYGANIDGLNVDGNQSAFTSIPGGGGFLLEITGNNPRLRNVNLINSPSEGLMADTIVGLQASNCHFDDNAYSGVDLRAMSYYHFNNCTLNRNGYGFQKTYATNAFQGFALAQRFRCHHGTWSDCEATQSGRDGFNTNQGSYKINYLGVTSTFSGDGGFTVSADNTGTGRPGEGESCYSLGYYGCAAEGNFSSGLAMYVLPGYDITVIGGRWVNNHNTAGLIPDTAVYGAGIAITGGSQGVLISGVKCYDDRQLCPITIASNGAVAATGWVTGLIGTYPRLAFYDSTMAFQGYGTATSEIAGSPTSLVGFSPTANNGVVFANIAAGWYVTQRLQHNGVFFDNNCQGTVNALEAWGQLPGAFTFTGFPVVSGFTANGQNVTLQGAQRGNQMLANPSWDADTTNWSYSLTGGGTQTYYTTAGANLRSVGCLQLTAGTSQAQANATLSAGALASAQNCFVEGTVWATGATPGDTELVLIWTVGGSTFTSTDNHPGGGYQQLLVGGFIPAGATNVSIGVRCAAGKTNYFDTASLVPVSFARKNLDYSYGVGRYLPS